MAPLQRPVCSITGVTADSEWGLVPGLGVYEFETDRDRIVRLHDSHLTDLVWQPGDLCASLGGSRAVRRALREAGVPNHQVHEERFAF